MAENESPPEAAPAPEPRIFFINSVMKAEDLVQSDAGPKEDRFQALETTAGADGPTTIQPPIDPRDLRLLVQRNSILRPLIDAYATNIDGTGWEIVPIEEAEEETEEEEVATEGVEDFFDEPWPGVSFTTVRKSIRLDEEETGNGYMEVIRNAKDEIRGARRLDSVDMRMIRLDDPVEVVKTVLRNGEDTDLTCEVRERRYAQILVGKLIYFKDFQATRDLNKKTGKWSEGGPDRDGERVDIADRATEIIHFTAIDDVDTPYGLPRWWSNSPSVTGSRKAEEFNLQFFDSGGVPPLLLIVQGGKLAADAERALRDHFMSTGEARHSAAILEAFAATGDVESNQSVRVTVERFGAERQQDSMFEKYGAACDERVRRAFRLPPIFTGNAQDFSFATAFASYTVAEAQVFQPEREEFDEKINLLLMPELIGAEGLKYKSLPLSVRDTAQQLDAIGTVAEKITPKSLVETINQITNLSLVLDEDKIQKDEEDKERDRQDNLDRLAAMNGGGTTPPAEGVVPNAVPGEQPAPGGPSPVMNMAKAGGITTGLASIAQEASGLLENGIDAAGEHSAAYANLLTQINSMTSSERTMFRAMLTLEMFPELANDPSGAAELASCAFALVAQHSQED
jgi:PBSX family phage portal protein